MAFAELRGGITVQLQRPREIVLGSTELAPGAEVASSVIDPMPQEWWLRPVSSACRVGEHSAVVWNR